MEPNKRIYLLTGGLVPLLQNRHNIRDLSEDTKKHLRTIEHAYFAETHLLLNGRSDYDKDAKEAFFWDVRFIPDEQIQRELKSLVKARKSTRPLVSFDDVYCVDLPDAHYHVTRIINPDNIDEDPELGPRFHADPLEAQAERIRKELGSEIDIMDIGTFAGDTIGGELKNRFANAGLKVKNVYLAFAGRKGLKTLGDMGLNIHPVHVHDWVDWLEIRDCLGFDGRKVANAKYGVKDPRYLFVRYSEKSEKWASIPEGIKHKYEDLYKKYFALIQTCLKGDGYTAKLEPFEEDSNVVYELTIKNNAQKQN